MRLSSVLACAVCICSLPVTGYAENLLEVYELAVQNDPIVKASQFEFSAREESVNQAVAGLLPTVTADADVSFNYQDILSTQNPVFSAGDTAFKNHGYAINISQPVFNWASWKRLSQAEASVKQATANNIIAQQDLIMRVAAAYLNILAARDNISFA